MTRCSSRRQTDPVSPTSAADWEERLRAHGYRITPQRQLVLEAVARLRHATPEAILTEVQRTASAVNLSTIYRTLEVLEDVGLVAHAHLNHRSPTYHPADDHVHVHLVCARCGRIQSVDADVVAGFVARLHTELGFETDVRHLSVQGLCAACAAGEDPEEGSDDHPGTPPGDALLPSS